ncbi:MAG: hypothetical protein ACE5E8_01265 [Acidimicrobiia bacterium]
MDTYRLAYSFKITRRIAVDFTVDELHGQAAKVVGHLRDMDGVVDQGVEADLGSASLQIVVSVNAANSAEAESKASECLARAIKASGAVHQGLLPERDERDFYRVGYSALKRQTWRQRRVDLACV